MQSGRRPDDPIKMGVKTLPSQKLGEVANLPFFLAGSSISGNDYGIANKLIDKVRSFTAEGAFNLFWKWNNTIAEWGVKSKSASTEG